MYKATYADVKDLIKWGKDDESVAHMVRGGLQPVGHLNAYFSPSQANWSWQIGIYKVNGVYYELLTRFGSVEGGRRLYTYDNVDGGIA